MDPEALIGRQAGTSTLQRVIGDGTLGVVYLGQQSEPVRQVAIKVFLRLASLEPHQQRAFLATFRDEMARVFALEHPHILPIYDYGDLHGLAYIVTPYVAGETLEDMLVREGALPLEMVASCLQQIAAALDYAHGQGIVHRDLKPANIFLTPEKKVVVADFHLTAMLVDGSTTRMRLSKPGLLDYSSPELITGKHIDQRADLYSLGALLYRMVTGVPLFQGQTLMKVATKHLKMPPLSPRDARPDLPPAAEQVILKALAKDPADRFENALDMSQLFQQAINSPTAGAPDRTSEPIAPLPVGTRFSAPDTLVPDIFMSGTPLSNLASSGATASDPVSSGSLVPVSITLGATASDASFPADTATPADVRPVNPVSDDAAHLDTKDSAFVHPPLFGPRWRANAPQFVKTASQEVATPQAGVQVNSLTPADQAPAQETLAPGPITWALPEIKQDESGTTGTYKLTSSARIVSIPVAGQPGRYVTGILPSSPQPTETTALPAPAQTPLKNPFLRHLRSSIFVLATLLIICGSVGFVFFHSGLSKHSGGSAITPAGTADFLATATARAQASAEANIILSDSLSRNIRGWPESSSGPFLFQFKDGAYHITNNDPARVASAILPGESLSQSFVYTLTMDEIRGDDTSINNESGMILRFNSQTKGGKQIFTFYTFEVVNNKGGQYQFWKYDNSQGTSASPWTQLASHPFGSEFHQGQGLANSNTFKILVNGKKFTLIVNGKQVMSVQDGSLTGGQVGMLVNLKGTEVAFSNLLLAWR